MTYQIRNWKYNLCLQAWDTHEAGYPVSAAPCDGKPHQQWQHGNSNQMGHVNVANGQCLDYPNYSDTRPRTNPCVEQTDFHSTQTWWHLDQYSLSNNNWSRACLAMFDVQGVVLGPQLEKCDSSRAGQAWAYP
ncbi:ricin-type beta-trefoil lectin domain protein [Amycolatopsis samaneae]|uniref:Ricin-type beta-trefoil lectin domain protein n=1 Tax=Amycolatopsis samaneae TaxID=664691 RepID=A0ABW5GPB4_9PSEU